MSFHENTVSIPSKTEGLKRIDFSFKDGLNLAEDFFMAKGTVYETMQRLVRRLDEEKIQYAIIGGMAITAHGYARLTLDVDILLTPEGLRTFYNRLVGKGYVPAFPGAKKLFLDTESKIRLEIITTEAAQMGKLCK